MPRYSRKHPPAHKTGPGPLPLILALAGAALILLAGWAIWSTSAPAAKTSIQVKGAPRLQVEKDSIDHGEVKLGTPITDEVRITNVGDQPLRFTKAPYMQVLEGCWPPTPAIGSMVLQPGESTTVLMKYMMHGDMGGPHDFRLHLLTNDPTQPDREIKLLSNWVE